MQKIVHAPNAVLSQPAKPVRVEQTGTIDNHILHLIADMKDALDHTEDPKGVGLAAPQVGKSLQIFIMKPTDKARVQIFINPQVAVIDDTNEKQTKKRSKQLEGCLSLPTIWGTVERRKAVLVTYLDEKGQKHEKVFRGFQAVIIQHEYDHLQGILFPKRVLEQNGKLYKSHKNGKGQDEFEEIAI
jgi:peptide deformylase